MTIAVIAERGPIKYTKAPVGVDKDEEEKKKKKKWDGKGKGVALEEDGGGGGGGGKKYVTLKMIDFGARSSSSSSGLGGSGIRGDAMLNLILFEADRVDLISNGGSSTTEKVYKGGSGGAFEKLMNVREGDVIALLNPRVLKPFSRANDGQTIPILALTPSTASSIMVIGRSRDLGMCTVRKADGKVCGAWCDKRDIGAGAGEVCEFHLEKAVIRQRAGRNEFAIGYVFFFFLFFERSNPWIYSILLPRSKMSPFRYYPFHLGFSYYGFFPFLVHLPLVLIPTRLFPERQGCQPLLYIKESMITILSENGG